MYSSREDSMIDDCVLYWLVSLDKLRTFPFSLRQYGEVAEVLALLMISCCCMVVLLAYNKWELSILNWGVYWCCWQPIARYIILAMFCKHYLLTFDFIDRCDSVFFIILFWSSNFVLPRRYCGVFLVIILNYLNRKLVCHSQDVQAIRHARTISW